MERISSLTKRVQESVDLSLKNKTFLKMQALELFGYTSTKNKIFLSNLANYDDVNYLELGVFRGSTIVPVALSNCDRCVGIDNFSYNPYRNPTWKTEGYIDVQNGVHDNLERHKVQNKVKIVKNDIFDTLFEFENVSEKNNLVYIDIEPITPIEIKVKEDEPKKYKKELTRFDFSNLFKRVIKSCDKEFIFIVANTNRDEKHKLITDVLTKIEDITIKSTTRLNNNHGMRQDDGWYNGLSVYVISKKESKK